MKTMQLGLNDNSIGLENIEPDDDETFFGENLINESTEQLLSVTENVVTEDVNVSVNVRHKQSNEVPVNVVTEDVNIPVNVQHKESHEVPFNLARERQLLYQRQEDRIQDIKYLYNRSFLPQRDEVLARTKMLDPVGAFTKMHLLEWNFKLETINFTKMMNEANRLDECEFRRKELLCDEWERNRLLNCARIQKISTENDDEDREESNEESTDYRIGTKTTGLYEDKCEIMDDEDEGEVYEGEIMDDEDEGEIMEDDSIHKVLVVSDQTTSHVWKGKLVYLPEKIPGTCSTTYDARRQMHDASGNTTFPCPSELLEYLEKRPPITFQGKVFDGARNQDICSACEPWDYDEDDSEDSDAPFYGAAVYYHKRFRMP
jgi:hypothetical protein